MWGRDVTSGTSTGGGDRAASNSDERSRSHREGHLGETAG